MVMKILNFILFFLSVTITLIFSCVFQQYSGVLITSVKKNYWGVVVFLGNIARKQPEMQKIFILGSLSSIQHYLPIYFSDNFVRKCSILAQNEKIMLGIYSSKIIQSCQSGQNRVKPQHAISEEPSIFEQKIFCNFSYGLSTYNTKKMKELVVVTSTNSQIMTLNRFMLKVYLCNKSIFYNKVAHDV